jgi:hypothetical protein
MADELLFLSPLTKFLLSLVDGRKGVEEWRDVGQGK